MITHLKTLEAVEAADEQVPAFHVMISVKSTDKLGSEEELGISKTMFLDE